MILYILHGLRRHRRVYPDQFYYFVRQFLDYLVLCMSTEDWLGLPTQLQFAATDLIARYDSTHDYSRFKILSAGRYESLDKPAPLPLFEFIVRDANCCLQIYRLPVRWLRVG